MIGTSPTSRPSSPSERSNRDCSVGIRVTRPAKQIPCTTKATVTARRARRRSTRARSHTVTHRGPRPGEYCVESVGRGPRARCGQAACTAEPGVEVRREVRGQHVLGRGGHQAELALGGARVEDEVVLHLVRDIGELADQRAEHAERLHHPGRVLGHLRRRDAGEARELGDGLALAHRERARHVPRAAPRALVGTDRDERRRHVLGVGPGVARVEARGDGDLLAGEQLRHDAVAEVALRAGADVVGAARLGGAHATGLVRGQRVEPHPVAHLSLGVGAGERHVLGHRPVDGAVAVEVGGRDQDGAGATRPRRAAPRRPAASR